MPLINTANRLNIDLNGVIDIIAPDYLILSNHD